MPPAQQPWDMLSRPRTQLFMQYRQTYQARESRLNIPSRGRDGDRENLLGGDNVEMDHLGGSGNTPTWIEVNRAADDVMNDIDEHLRELKKIMSTAAMPTFDDVIDEEQTVEIQAQYIQKRLFEAQHLIRTLNTGDRGETESDTKARTNVSTALASRLSTQSHALRRLQMDFLKRLQGTQQHNSDLFRDDTTVSAEEYDMGFTDEQIREVLNRETFAEERERDINQIAQSIAALAEMFRELQTLIIDQGTILDRIDYNIEMAVQHTEAAHKDLIAAEKSQKKYRNKLCILFLIVMAVALVLVLSFKPRSSGSSGSEQTTP